MKFTEAKLEKAYVELLKKQGYTHLKGEDFPRDSNQEGVAW